MVEDSFAIRFGAAAENGVYDTFLDFATVLYAANLDRYLEVGCLCGARCFLNGGQW